MYFRTAFGIAVLCTLSSTLGYWFGSDGEACGTTQHAIRSQSGTLTNPLLECESETASTDPRIILMQRDLSDELHSTQRALGVPTLSVYFRDLNNGPWFGINEHEEFAPASLVKVPTLITILKQSEFDPTLFSKKIMVTQQMVDVAAHERIVAAVTAQANTEYSVEELLRLMIVHSDNVATNALATILTLDLLGETFRQVGVPFEIEDRDLSLSVREYASFFRILYNASYLTIEKSEYALNLLTEAAFVDGLVAPLPDGSTVAHKFGERYRPDALNPWQLHDCGIVYYPEHPYLLCVMTRGTDIEQQKQLIQAVSERFYREVDEQFRGETSS